jgi:oligopeptide transport system permease protein
LAAPWCGPALLASLWLLSFALGVVWPQGIVRHCPLGQDALRPDSTVCELALGGLWISLSIGVAAAVLSTAFGLVLAVLARLARGRFEIWSMRFADAFFALPDVLVLMVVQFAAQLLGDLHPTLKVAPVALMIFSLAVVGWSAPARMLGNRLATLEQQEFIAAARALGAGRGHLLKSHLWPALRPFLAGILLARVPASIVAESTVSFLGIARVEPMSLGRYLGTSYGSLLYPSGARIVLPAWGMLVLIVLGAALASRGLVERAR